MSLNSLAIILSGLGQREAALVAVREAVALRRTLSVQHPDAFGPPLAMSLNNLAIMLGALGQHEAALAAAQEEMNLDADPCSPTPRRVSARHGNVAEYSGKQAARTWPTRGCARSGAAGGGTTVAASLAGIPMRFGRIWQCR